MIAVHDLLVKKNGTAICRVPELCVAPGERVGIVGANGSGKTTLLRVLAGLERDFEGTCRVAARRRERVFVHQSTLLFRGTVLANVLYGLKARGRRGPAAGRATRRWLEILKIDHLARRKSHLLSGGEARRTALARAAVVQPDLLLLDEPLADIDAAGIEAVRQMLAALPDTTVLLAAPNGFPAGMVEKTCRIQRP